MSDEMLLMLQGLLQQLELAQGAHDPEARARLDQLRQQLGVLDAAKQRALAADATGAADGGGAGIAVPLRGNASGSSGGAGPEDGTGSSSATSLAGGAATMLQQMDGLSARLAGLEYRLAHLDGNSRAVLVQSAGGWLGALQTDGGEADGGSGVEGLVVEMEEMVVVEEEACEAAAASHGGA